MLVSHHMPILKCRWWRVYLREMMLQGLWSSLCQEEKWSWIFCRLSSKPNRWTSKIEFTWVLFCFCWDFLENLSQSRGESASRMAQDIGSLQVLKGGGHCQALASGGGVGWVCHLPSKAVSQWWEHLDTLARLFGLRSLPSYVTLGKIFNLCVNLGFLSVK